MKRFEFRDDQSGKFLEDELLEWTPALRRRLAPSRRGGAKRPSTPSVEKLWDAAHRGAREALRGLRGGLDDTEADLRPFVEEAIARLENSAPPSEIASDEVEVLTFKMIEQFNPTTPVVDLWVKLGSLESAVRCAVRLSEFKVSIARRFDVEIMAYPAVVERAEENLRNFQGGGARQPWMRLRRHLAGAPQKKWDAAFVVAESLYDDAPAAARVGLAYAFADHPAWAEEELRLSTPEMLANPGWLDLLTVCRDSDLAVRVIEYNQRLPFAESQIPLILSIYDAGGPKVVPALASRLKEGGLFQREELAAALALFRHHDVLSALFTHAEDETIEKTFRDAVARSPEIATDVLANAATSEENRERALGTLRHLLAEDPSRAEHVNDPAARAIVEEILKDQTRQDEAAADALPTILAQPPWLDATSDASSASSNALPSVKEVGEIPFERRENWRDGEREDWLRSPLPDWLEPSTDGPRWRLAQTLKLGGNLLELETLVKEDPEAALQRVREGAESMLAILPKKESWDRTERIESLFDLQPELQRLVLREYPPNIWESEAPREVSRRLAAQHGLDALPALLVLARRYAVTALPTLGPFLDPSAAPIVVSALGKKTGRTTAVALLRRNPEAMAAGLLPLVARGGKEREAAITALGIAAELLDDDVLTRMIESLDEDAAAVVRAILDRDPLDAWPRDLSREPFFWPPGELERPRLRDGGAALPTAAMEHLCTMLRFTSFDLPYAGLRRVQDACEPGSLAEFAWDLFSAWGKRGYPSSENWTMRALGIFGDDETARRLTPLLRVWPGESAHHRAVEGLDVLAAIGSDVALMHLNGIAQKVKYKGLRARAGEKIEEIAGKRGLSSEELADRLAPTLDLDAAGSMTLDFGPRRFVVSFDEQLKPVLRDEGGAPRKSLPKANKSDDAALAKEATTRFRNLKKDVRASAGIQLARLEAAMCDGRRWAKEDFRVLLAGHPLLGHLVRRLVWGAFDADDELLGAFRVAEDGTWADSEDETWDAPADAKIGLVHPAEIAEELRAAFSEVFADYEMLQPFAQLGREVFELPADEQDKKSLKIWDGRTVGVGGVLALEKRGWVRGAPQDGGVSWWTERPLKTKEGVSTRAILVLEPGIVVGMPTEFAEQKLGEVFLARMGGYDARGERPFSELGVVALSELLRDLNGLAER